MQCALRVNAVRLACESSALCERMRGCARLKTRAGRGQRRLPAAGRRYDKDLSLRGVEGDDQVSENSVLLLLREAQHVCRRVFAAPLLIQALYVAVMAQDNGELGLFVKVGVPLRI
jgi:hypothetical protein